MKKPIIRSVGRLESIKTSDQKLSVPITVSFFGHLVFCLLFIFLPKVTLNNHTPPRIINVQLVTPSAQITAPAPSVQPTPLPAAAQVEAPKPAPEAAVSTAPKAEEAVSLAPAKIEKKQSMKKRTYKRERLLESAIKNVEKQVEASKADPKQQALDRIRSELEERADREPEEDDGTATAAIGMAGEGTPTSDILRIYYAEVAYRIQRNWAFSEQLAGGEEDLYNEVGFKIMRNGEIRDLWFDRRSGNSYLDDSARKAILKSSPLPPIPDEIKGSYIPLGARFTPEGIN